MYLVADDDDDDDDDDDNDDDGDNDDDDDDDGDGDDHDHDHDHEPVFLEHGLKPHQNTMVITVIGMQVTDTLMLHPLYSFARMPRMAQGHTFTTWPRTPPDVLLLRKISECAVLLWEELYH